MLGYSGVLVRSAIQRQSGLWAEQTIPIALARWATDVSIEIVIQIMMAAVMAKSVEPKTEWKPSSGERANLANCTANSRKPVQELEKKSSRDGLVAVVLVARAAGPNQTGIAEIAEHRNPALKLAFLSWRAEQGPGTEPPLHGAGRFLEG
jgi:p-aminobenzoyl-glutamate transporter AbgT